VSLLPFRTTRASSASTYVSRATWWCRQR